MGQPTHSSILQVTGCTICGEAYETGQCIPTEENTQENGNGKAIAKLRLKKRLGIESERV